MPNKLFFDPEDGIISIFNRYNFTVEENSPSEQQVALDPELLGKVFENLLGAYNPETEQTARNQSGSFYTPREIVNYMVDISLQSYLGDSDEVKALFADDFEYDESKKVWYQEIIDKLKAIKVLDPACGSGAFPIGMLNRIVQLLQNLKAQGSKYDLKLQYPNMTKYLPFYYDENSSLFKFCFIDNFPELLGGTRELRKIFFDKIPVKEVSDEVDAEFRTLVLDIQADYSDEKAKAIDQKIFDLYGLTPEEREAIGYIDIK